LRDFVATAPDELTVLAAFITAPPAPFVPAEMHFQPAIAVAVCYAGDAASGEHAVRPVRTFGPPAADVIGPLPYPALQAMLDETAPYGLQNYWKSAFLGELSDAAIDVLVARAAAMRSPLAAIHVHHLGGAVSRMARETSAFVNRDSRFVVNIVGTWQDPADSDENVAWTRETFDALAPHAAGGGYINFMGEEAADRVRAAYGTAVYNRLQTLKREYDPNNLFRLNQNVRP
jgi:Berberine and berberine like